MSEHMVEVVARAIEHADDEWAIVEEGCAAAFWQSLARAAIEALRELADGTVSGIASD